MDFVSQLGWMFSQATGRERTPPTERVPPPPPEPTPWLFLKGLGRDALERADVLPEVFSAWGVGASARSIVDPVTRTKRGTAVVRLQSVNQVCPHPALAQVPCLGDSFAYAHPCSLAAMQVAGYEAALAPLLTRF